MNQEKIGKFIAERRKIKKMTQMQLGEKLGVSDRSVSKWENGKCMPDLSLFEPLCKELEINVNELLSGEHIPSDKYQEIVEENMMSTIDYTRKIINDKNNTLGTVLLIFGFLIVLTAISVFPSESSWSAIYSIIGVIVSLIGFSKYIKKLNLVKRIILNLSFVIIACVLLLTLDYSNVVNNRQVPRFSYRIHSKDETMLYETPFYNVYRINKGTLNEYLVVDNKKKLTVDTVPISPFKRDRSGIDNIIKYRNKYIGNNSNIGNLLSALPLTEYGFVFEIDSKELGLTVDYHTTDWYNNDNYYIRKALIYNSVSIFMLVDNVQWITYNFSGNSYTVDRMTIENKYPNYFKVIKNNEIDQINFNKYIENRMNDNNFVHEMYEKLLYDIKK